jgi:hypothetical protein
MCLYLQTRSYKQPVTLAHKTHKEPKLNTLEKFEIYKHHKKYKNEMLSDQIIYNDHTLYDIITQ